MSRDVFWRVDALLEHLEVRLRAPLEVGDADGLRRHQRDVLGRAWRMLEDQDALLLCAPLGWGKTHLACALARKHARASGARPIIVTPARLRDAWRRVSASMGVDARFFSHRDASLDRLPRADLALWIVDEAHAFRNPTTRRHLALAEALSRAPACLVSATPFNTRGRDVRALLALISGVDAHGPEELHQIFHAFALIPPEMSADVMRHRVEVIRRVERYPLGGDADGWRRFIDRLMCHDWPLARGDMDTAALLRGLLLARLASHPAALASTLRRLLRYFARGVAPGTDGAALDPATFRRLFGADGPVQGLLSFAWPDASKNYAPPDLACTKALLTSSLQWLTERDVLGVDQRLDEVLEGALGPPWRRASGLCSPPLAVVFSRYAESAEAAQAMLSRRWSVGLMTGRQARVGRAPTDPLALLRAFDPTTQLAPCCQVLVCTDVLAQGHNLQAARALIHLDQPWNPVCLAQREGRLVRVGQRARQVLLVSLRPLSTHPSSRAFAEHQSSRLSERRQQACALMGGFAAPLPERWALTPRGASPLVTIDAFGRRLPLAAQALLDWLYTLPGDHRVRVTSAPLDAFAGVEVERLLAMLMQRVRAQRHHPDAEGWCARIATWRRALVGPLRAGARLQVEAASRSVAEHAYVEDVLDAVERCLERLLTSV